MVRWWKIIEKEIAVYQRFKKGSSTPSGQSPVNNWAEEANQQVQSVHKEKHTNTLRGRLLTHNKEEERLISSTYKPNDDS